MKRKILNLVSFNIVFSLVSCAMCFLSFNTVYDYGQLFSLNSSPHITNIYDFYQRIDLDKAWDFSLGSSFVSIGVIDTGFNPTFSSLQGNIDFNLSSDLFDSNRGPFSSINLPHGTSVACRLGGNGINGISSSGVTRNSKLVALRVDCNTYPDYEEDFMSVVSAIAYAQTNNIPILNFSGGFYASDLPWYYNTYHKPLLEGVINQYDGLIVCAAGNGNENLNNPERYDVDSGAHTLFPACLTNSNIIVVGGTDEDSDALHCLTNYGTTSVDLFAPGGEGTSLAAPLVAGTAALMLSVNPNLTATQLKQKIMNGVDYISGYNNYCVSGGRLNVYRSVLLALPVLEEGANLSTYELEYGVDQWYQFTCDYGYYSIQTTGNVDTIGYLYSDPLGNPICSSSSGGSGNNFLISQHLSPGTYYLRVSANPYSPSAQFSIVFNNHSHLYNDYSIPAGPTKHRSYCECGASQLKPHVFPVDPNGIIMPCVVCGYSNGGLILSNLNFELESFNTDSYISKDGIVYLGPYDYNEYINNLTKGGMINE